MNIYWSIFVGAKKTKKILRNTECQQYGNNRINFLSWNVMKLFKKHELDPLSADFKEVHDGEGIAWYVPDLVHWLP